MHNVSIQMRHVLSPRKYGLGELEAGMLVALFCIAAEIVSPDVGESHIV